MDDPNLLLLGGPLHHRPFGRLRFANLDTPNYAILTKVPFSNKLNDVLTYLVHTFCLWRCFLPNKVTRVKVYNGLIYLQRSARSVIDGRASRPSSNMHFHPTTSSFYMRLLFSLLFFQGWLNWLKNYCLILAFETDSDFGCLALTSWHWLSSPGCMTLNVSFISPVCLTLGFLSQTVSLWLIDNLNNISTGLSNGGCRRFARLDEPQYNLYCTIYCTLYWPPRLQRSQSETGGGPCHSSLLAIKVNYN